MQLSLARTTLLFLMISFLRIETIQSQSFADGGFDNYSSSGLCGVSANAFQTELSGAGFTDFALFGAGNICYTDGGQSFTNDPLNLGVTTCPGQSPIPSTGTYSVGLAKDVVFALRLTSDLTNGNCYTITFDVQNKATNGSSDLCAIVAGLEFGLSGSPASFGTSVATTGNITPADSWQTLSVSFSVPSTALNYITLRIPTSVSAVEAFLYVDNMSLASVDCSTLPIEMGAFNVIAENGSAKLNWTTLSETNNKGFEVERSIDGEKWSTIGFVGSRSKNNNSSQPLNYSFNDESPEYAVINYYRLKQIDIDGKQVYSDIRFIKIEASSFVKLSPNPVHDMLLIKISDWRQVKEIDVMDNAGRVMYSARENKQQIDMSTFATGIYFLRITKTNGTIHVEKIVKL